MRISASSLIYDRQRVKIIAPIEFSGVKEYLWYEVDAEYADFLTLERLDAFLVGLIILAMKHQEDIYIDGIISEKLFYNLTNYLMKILSLLIPSLHIVKIFPEKLDQEIQDQPSRGVATGFSGGIDSFCTFIEHFIQHTPESYRLTHLVFNNVGSHGQGGRELFNKRYNKLLNFAQEQKIPLIKIDSNIDEILQVDFRKTHGVRNISAILTLQKLFGKYLYASAHKYENCFIGESQDGAVIDPAAIHLFSTKTTECISSGCQYSRVEKTIKVSIFEPSYRYLDICVHAIDMPENCSSCWKCVRTLITLEILGKHDCYRQVFDLNKFSRFKGEYIASIVDSQKPLEKEVIHLAAERNYSLSKFHNNY
jgi:hypothetical protein